jgi:SAM-dependent methyltransferase
MPITQAEIQAKASDRFQEQIGRTYTTYRGITPLYREIETYPLLLKDDCGRNIFDVVQGRVDSGDNVDILDLGCGTGRFLIQCARRWPGRVTGSGITATIYDEIAIPNGGPQYSFKKDKEELCVDVQVKDICSLDTTYPENSKDIVTSVYTANYLVDSWSLIRLMHRALRIGGEGFVGQFPLNLVSISEEKYLINYLEREAGFSFIELSGGWTLYYQKLDEKLVLPLIPDRFEDDKVHFVLPRRLTEDCVDSSDTSRRSLFFKDLQRSQQRSLADMRSTADFSAKIPH